MIANLNMNNAAVTTSPTADEMLEMLNVDVFPFFDSYDEDSFTFAEKFRAVKVVAEKEEGFVISLNNGQEIEISKNYFQFPGTEKTSTVQKLKTILG